MTLLMTKLYFRILSWLWPAEAGRIAFRAFQKSRKLPFKSHEQEFYDKASKFNIVHPRESIHAYEMGDPNGRLIILVHGWDSNAGSMSSIASRLSESGCRVVTFDLPAHGKSALTHTNLKECAEALRALIYQLRPDSLTVVSHSFGSAVATIALSGTRYKIDNFIMLTAPNQLVTLFDQFRSIIGLGNKAYEELLRLSASILNSPVSWLSVSEKLKRVNFGRLALVHDKWDRILPISNSLEIKSVTNAQLYEFENVGHYRMLHNADVIDIILNEIQLDYTKVEGEEPMLQLAV